MFRLADEKAARSSIGLKLNNGMLKKYWFIHHQDRSQSDTSVGIFMSQLTELHIPKIGPPKERARI